ncbi:PREDICTED: uncharacterized protein LOC109217322 [Nicotiana attenuata]|uniref:uncharacterized protein LOC109217322 n=1 Tax=Nicotiana attenuata TaxID=49451 RepID=UPI0009048086|nr:PREDICTED: uncharacterized protein LOC109217322 [Nicotiana attenuata]
MKYVSFDRNDIDKHYQKVAEIYFEVGGDINLKQAFVSSLPKLLASRTMTIIEEKFQSHNHPSTLDKACRKSDLHTGSGCSCHTSRRRRGFRRFRWQRIPDEKSRSRRRKKYFRRRRPGNFHKNNRCFIFHKIGHFAKTCPQSRKSVKLLQEIEDYISIHLEKEDDLESMFSMDDEPTEETLFSLDIYEDHGDDHYQISEPAAKAQEEINAIIVIPQVELKVYSSKRDKPTQVTAFIDTGDACLLMNPVVLLEDQWVPDTLEEHVNLLRQFEALVTQYGIMLSAKKMVFAQKEIDFLGMHFVQGAYSPGPHICPELLKFLDTSLTIKHIQQFLGVVNYVRDFIPNTSTYISPLTEMLKKNTPSWGKKQDEAVREIKEISKNVKSLYIPSEGKKILQTDAKNEY